MNILLIGERFSLNLGDALICETVYKIIRKEFGDDVTITFFDISGKTSYSEFFRYQTTLKLKIVNWLEYHFPSLLEKNPLFCDYKKSRERYLRSLSLLNQLLRTQKFDLAVFAGGQMFLDYFAGLVHCVVKRLSFFKIPIVFHACGLSKLSDSSVKLLKKTFSSKYVKNISVRDSKEKFQSIFGDVVAVDKTFDTALCCSEYYSANIKKISDYGIGLINLSQHKDLQRQIVEYFLKNHISWKIFTNGSPYDQSFAEEILMELGVEKVDFGKYICDRPRSPVELVETVTGFNKILSFRLHSQIVASSFGISSYGVVWDEKVRDFYDDINFCERCFSLANVLDSIPSITSNESSDDKDVDVGLLAEESKKNLLYQIKSTVEGG